VGRANYPPLLYMPHKHLEDCQNIIVKKNNIWANITGRPFAVGKTIRIPSKLIRNADEYKARMTHFVAHIYQCKFSSLYGWFVFVPKWLLSRKFRAICEMPAFWDQMECYRDCSGLMIIKEKMHETLVKKYYGAFTDNLASAFIHAFEMKRNVKDWKKFYEENL